MHTARRLFPEPVCISKPEQAIQFLEIAKEQLLAECVSSWTSALIQASVTFLGAHRVITVGEAIGRAPPTTTWNRDRTNRWPRRYAKGCKRSNLAASSIGGEGRRQAKEKTTDQRVAGV